MRALRALAHPLRNRLLGLLRLHGPATASQLGRAGRREQRRDQLPPAPARGLRLRRGGRGPGHRARALVAGPAPDDQLGGGRRRRPGGRRRGRGRDDPPAARPARPRPQRLAGAEGRARPAEWTAVASLNDYALRLRPEQARALAAELERRAARAGWTRTRPTARRGRRTGQRPARRRPAEGVAGMSAPHDRPLGHPPAGRPHRAALAAGRAHQRRSPCCSRSPAACRWPRSACCSPCTASWSSRSSCPPAGSPTSSAGAPWSSPVPLLHLVSCVVFATATSFPGFLAGVLLLGVGPGAGLRSGRGLVRRHRPPHRPGGRRRAGPRPALGGRRRQPRPRRRRRRPAARAARRRRRRTALALPYLAAAALDLVFIVAVLRLLTEDRPPREGSVARRARRRVPAPCRHGRRRRPAVGHRRADAAGPAAHRGRRRRAGGLRAARARCGSPSWPAVRTTAPRSTARRSPSPSASPRSVPWRRPRCAGCCAAPPGSPARVLIAARCRRARGAGRAGPAGRRRRSGSPPTTSPTARPGRC